MKHGDEAKVTLGHLQVSSAQARSCGQVKASSEWLITVCLSKHISLSVKLQSICPTPGAFETEMSQGQGPALKGWCGNTEINQGMESGDIYPTLYAILELAGSV